MGFWQAVSTCLGEKYLTFSGRAARSEYWFFWLFVVLVSLGLTILLTMMEAAHAGTGILLFVGLKILFSLFVFLPNIAVGVRRLHDIDRSGWWLLLPLAMMVAGGIVAAIAAGGGHGGEALGLAVLGGFTLLGCGVLLVFTLLPGTDGSNRYGPDPRFGQGRARFA